MLVYIIPLIYALIMAIRYDYVSDSNANNTSLTRETAKIQKLILLIMISCIAGFSYRLGIDSTRYEMFFDLYPDISELSGTKFLFYSYNGDPGWIIFNSICKSIIDEFWFVKLLTALFVNSVFFWFINKHTTCFFTTIIFYFLFQYWNFNFEILRESISVSFFLLALDNILQEKINLKKYYLFTLPTIFFQSFGFLTLFFPLLLKISFGRNFKFLIFISILLIPFLMNFSSYVTNLGILGEEATRKMEEKYLDEGNIYGSEVLSIYGIVQHLISCIGGLLILYNNRYNIKRTLLSYSIFYMLVTILMFGYAILYRINNYMLIPCYISMAIITVNSLKQKNLINFILLLMFFYPTIDVRLQRNYWKKYAPYSSIFTKSIDTEREQIFNNGK